MMRRNSEEKQANRENHYQDGVSTYISNTQCKARQCKVTNLINQTERHSTISYVTDSIHSQMI